GPLIRVTTPYARRGVVSELYRRHYSVGDPLQGTSSDFNSTLSLMKSNRSQNEKRRIESILKSKSSRVQNASSSEINGIAESLCGTPNRLVRDYFAAAGSPHQIRAPVVRDRARASRFSRPHRTNSQGDGGRRC